MKSAKISNNFDLLGTEKREILYGKKKDKYPRADLLLINEPQ